jgi:biotin carboxyl carrier protein
MKFKLTIDGAVYEVDVEATEPEAPRPSYIPPSDVATHAPAPVPLPPTAGNGASVADESKVCRSPVTGMVVKVQAQSGQSIQASDVLLVVEAMKMETSITAPRAGKIAAVKVALGDAVQGGQVLVEFE